MNKLNKLSTKERQEEKARQLLKTRPIRFIRLNKLDLLDCSVDSNCGLDLMAAEMRMNGLLVPISVVAPYSGGRYKVIDGARRIKGMREFLTSEMIPCYIVSPKVGEEQLEMLALSANHANRTVSKSVTMAYTAQLRKLVIKGKVMKWEVPEILASMAGITTRQAAVYLQVEEKASPKVNELVASDKLAMRAAASIVSAIDDDAEQDAVADMYMNAGHGEKKHISEELKEMAREKKKAEKADVVRKGVMGVLENEVYRSKISAKEAQEKAAVLEAAAKEQMRIAAVNQNKARATKCLLELMQNAQFDEVEDLAATCLEFYNKFKK